MCFYWILGNLVELYISGMVSHAKFIAHNNLGPDSNRIEKGKGMVISLLVSLINEGCRQGYQG
jgi:hypothetical protein